MYNYDHIHTVVKCKKIFEDLCHDLLRVTSPFIDLKNHL